MDDGHNESGLELTLVYNYPVSMFRFEVFQEYMDM